MSATNIISYQVEVEKLRELLLSPDTKDIIGIPIVFAIDEEGNKLEWPNKKPKD